MSQMTRIRTIKETVAEIKAADPKSAITEHFLRQMCIDNAPFAFNSGQKYLINLDLLELYFLAKGA